VRPPVEMGGAHKPRITDVGSWALLVSAAGSVAAQVAVLTALLYYMGWVRSHATLGYFGIDPRMLDYSTQDYVLRSLNSTFAPLIVGTLAVVGAVKLHETLVEPRISLGGTWTVRTLRLGLLVGVGLASLVSVELVAPTLFPLPRGLVLPAALVLSLFLLSYCSYILSRVKPRETGGAEGFRRFRLVSTLGLGLVAVLWLLAVYADESGAARAEDIVGRLEKDPEVTVYSEFPLAINGLGVGVAQFGADGHKYRYVYTGLRLLVSSNENLVLVSPAWRKGEKIYVIDDDESVRVDFTANR
jgi:hypothetical protein